MRNLWLIYPRIFWTVCSFISLKINSKMTSLIDHYKGILLRCLIGVFYKRRRLSFCIKQRLIFRSRINSKVWTKNQILLWLVLWLKRSKILRQLEKDKFTTSLKTGPKEIYYSTSIYSLTKNSQIYKFRNKFFNQKDSNIKKKSS